jgi:thiamine biosynthesis protein ThiI
VVLLVRFGEIALKSRYVRNQFLRKLAANVQDQFAMHGVPCVVERSHSRLYVFADDEGAAGRLLRRVFGVVSFSPAEEVSADRRTVVEASVAYALRRLRSGMSFAVRPRRTGTHPYTSMDLAKEVGAAVLAARPGVRVDLGRPDFALHVEVRQDRAFVFHEIVPGPGGLPLDTQGRVVALVEDDGGMVAAWLMMKRGCRTIVATRDGDAWVDALGPWDPHLRHESVTGLKDLPEVARRHRAHGIALGWRLEDVAARREKPFDRGVCFYPIAGLADDELADLASRIRAG